MARQPTRGDPQADATLTKAMFARRKTSKFEIKPKFVVEFDKLLSLGEEELVTLTERTGYWEEFFLLSVKEDYVKAFVQNMREEQLLERKANVQNLFFNCLNMLQNDLEARQLNSINLLCIFVSAIFAKPGWNNFNFDIVNLISGLDNAPIVFSDLVDNIEKLLVSEKVQIATAALRLAVIFITASDNVSGNIMNEHFARQSLFQSFATMTLNPPTPAAALDSLLLIGIIANYKKYEVAQNPFLGGLAELDDEAALKNILSMFSDQCNSARNSYIIAFNDEEAGYSVTQGVQGIVTYLWSWTGTAGTGSAAAVGEAKNLLPPLESSLLLPIYELAHNNRAFTSRFIRELLYSRLTAIANEESSSAPSTPVSQSNGQDKGSPSSAAPTSATETRVGQDRGSPAFISFLSFASYLVQHNSTMRSLVYSKLSLLILLVLTEDPSALGMFCDATSETSLWDVRLCRQRQPFLPRTKGPRPLACVILDVVVAFMSHNLRRKLQTDMYSLCMSVVLRIIYHLRKFRIHLDYHWSEVWNCLITLMRFVNSNEERMAQRMHIGPMISSVIQMWNLFINYGDAFLPDGQSYDTLYYEIIRNHDAFDRSEEFMRRINLLDKETDSPRTETARTRSQRKMEEDAVQRNVRNVKRVYRHFSEKIDIWKESHRVAAFTMEQVLGIIRSNYQSLELGTPSEDPNHLARYSENPSQVGYFRQLVRTVVSDLKSREFGTVGPASPIV